MTTSSWYCVHQGGHILKNTSQQSVSTFAILNCFLLFLPKPIMLKYFSCRNFHLTWKYISRKFDREEIIWLMLLRATHGDRAKQRLSPKHPYKAIVFAVVFSISLFSIIPPCHSLSVPSTLKVGVANIFHNKIMAVGMKS